MDGTNLLPLLRGQAMASRSVCIWYLPFYQLHWGATPSAIVREGDWKLIEFFGDWIDPDRSVTRWERGSKLYHLRNDLGERQNLAGTEHARAEAMRTRLRAG